MSKINFADTSLPLDGTYKLTFGKHQGKAIEEIPSSYLRWVIEWTTKANLADAMAAELTWRDRHHAHIEDDFVDPGYGGRD